MKSTIRSQGCHTSCIHMDAHHCIVARLSPILSSQAHSPFVRRRVVPHSMVTRLSPKLSSQGCPPFYCSQVCSPFYRHKDAPSYIIAGMSPLLSSQTCSILYMRRGCSPFYRRRDAPNSIIAGLSPIRFSQGCSTFYRHRVVPHFLCLDGGCLPFYRHCRRIPHYSLSQQPQPWPKTFNPEGLDCSCSTKSPNSGPKIAGWKFGPTLRLDI